MKKKKILLILIAFSILCAVGSLFIPRHIQTYEPVVQRAPTVEKSSVVQSEKTFNAYLTGYAYWDNTPPGSGIIAFPDSLRDTAGGTGTYADPITMAVGHTISRDGTDTSDYPPGERFYVPRLHKYFIVEDTCGDGRKPQNGACHVLNDEAIQTGAQAWFDLWIGGGAGDSKTALQECESNITGTTLVIENPTKDYTVDSRPIFPNCLK